MEVTVISTSPRKEKEAREHLGADHFIVSRNEEQMTVRPPHAPIVPHDVTRHISRK